MNSNDTSRNDAITQQEPKTEKSARLRYLDWLQVLAILGVFLFHAVHPFDDLADWHIKNVEKSVLATFFVGFFVLWGMPFFFLMAGATSWFSLRRRTAGRYVHERVTRLLFPFIIGAIVLTPIQAYYELTHKGWWQGGSIIEFILSSEARTYFYTEYHPLTFGPEIFGAVGYHLWFVAFLFAFSLIALPVFTWLNGDSGKRFVASLAQLPKWRGGLLVFVIPLILIRFILQPFFPEYSGWSDFFFLLVFFISGYILIADERFMRAIRRDWLLYLILGIACTLFFFSVAAGVPVYDWLGSPGTPMFYVSQTLWGINSWCWTMFIFYVGMRFLDYTNKRLQYSREASYPFFFFHQPVIIFIAFYAVQWEAHLLIKLLVVVIGSFAVSLGLYELFVRRINPVRTLFGMKPRRRKEEDTKTALA
ncbi:MAG: acyltransferase family protein [Anaerolineales bacterium]|nr:acyltransferase family protein [Anaerolineales bacterium]